MKNIALVVFLIFLSCNSRPSESRTTTNFDWLLGKWERTNEAEGKITHEYWNKINDLEYHGTSFTLQNQDTVWQENVVLRANGNDWFFEVTAKNESHTTPFKLTAANATSFVCENKANEFPKRIEYVQQSDSIFHAQISAGETKVDFNFRRIAEP